MRQSNSRECLSGNKEGKENFRACSRKDVILKMSRPMSGCHENGRKGAKKTFTIRVHGALEYIFFILLCFISCLRTEVNI